MLRLERVTAGYGGVPVLHDVSMTVEARHITAVIGSNGAGKTTTLKAIVNAIGVLTGTISFEGEYITSLTPHDVVRRGISLVPEGRKIFARLTVAENLRVGAFVERDRKKVAERMAEVFDFFPRLAERRNQLGSALSGGEQQMLAIGRALMSNPKVLLLDEPSMGLAPLITDLVFEAIETLRNKGCTILLVEQNARRALSMVDTAYVLESGRIVMSGPGKVLLSDQRIVDAYLGG
jgi:branched-chain amino acid transport system ATP-binding protein